MIDELGEGSGIIGTEEDWETVEDRNVPAEGGDVPAEGHDVPTEGGDVPAEHLLASMIVVERTALSGLGPGFGGSGTDFGRAEAERYGSEMLASMILVDPPEREASPEKGDETWQKAEMTSPSGGTENGAQNEADAGNGKGVVAEERAREAEEHVKEKIDSKDLPVSEPPREEARSSF